MEARNKNMKKEDCDGIEIGVAVGGEGALAIVWACYGLNTAVTMIFSSISNGFL